MTNKTKETWERLDESKIRSSDEFYNKYIGIKFKLSELVGFERLKASQRNEIENYYIYGLYIIDKAWNYLWLENIELSSFKEEVKKDIIIPILKEWIKSWNKNINLKIYKEAIINKLKEFIRDVPHFKEKDKINTSSLYLDNFRVRIEEIEWQIPSKIIEWERSNFKDRVAETI